jgi:hypothetical protein
MKGISNRVPNGIVVILFLEISRPKNDFDTFSFLTGKCCKNHFFHAKMSSRKYEIPRKMDKQTQKSAIVQVLKSRDTPQLQCTF